MAQYGLAPETVKNAALTAAEILTGMGYYGKYGSVHLLRLNIQTNTLTAILHNMVAWQIAEPGKRWEILGRLGIIKDQHGQSIEELGEGGT